MYYAHHGGPETGGNACAGMDNPIYVRPGTWTGAVLFKIGMCLLFDKPLPAHENVPTLAQTTIVLRCDAQLKNSGCCKDILVVPFKLYYCHQVVSF